MWTYVSIGGWAATEAANLGTEFIICTASDDARAVELLAMTAFHNRGGKLGVGHTLRIGEPWLPGSKCDHLLVSLPYPFWPESETTHVGDRHVQFLWLLPITEAERRLKISDGLEALELRFDEVGPPYWQTDRPSVV